MRGGTSRGVEDHQVWERRLVDEEEAASGEDIDVGVNGGCLNMGVLGKPGGEGRWDGGWDGPF